MIVQILRKRKNINYPKNLLFEMFMLGIFKPVDGANPENFCSPRTRTPHLGKCKNSCLRAFCFNLRFSRKAVRVGLKGSSIISGNSNDCLPCIFDDTACFFCLKKSFLMNALYLLVSSSARAGVNVLPVGWLGRLENPLFDAIIFLVCAVPPAETHTRTFIAAAF